MTTVDLIELVPKACPKRGYTKSKRYNFHLHFMFFKTSFTFPSVFLNKKINQKGFKLNRNFHLRRTEKSQAACRMNSKAEEMKHKCFLG